ncbi:MAG: methyltransferase domain-containing protein [Deltaproteobacteria bacterium]|nr:methyltransferase domain-containing protein [Deltaproteobacteria bacterium]
MKKVLIEMLICPLCLPEEHRLRETLLKHTPDDIVEGDLRCEYCRKTYPIREGIAFLDPNHSEEGLAKNRYETAPLLSAYLWSHYGDLLQDELATDAYRAWADLMQPHANASLDTGSAMGRFSFEMAQKCDFVVGIDNSVSFIRTSRDLMIHRGANFELPEEGRLMRQERFSFPEDWKTDNIEFVVGDAQAIPFRSGLFSSVSSLNVVDKVPKPLTHLIEINRIARTRNAQLLFSDPFSWSAEVADPESWLGGTPDGTFSGWGRENIIALLEGKRGAFAPTWQIDRYGHVWWKIRTHSNHFELIRSCFIKAFR